MIFTFIYFSRSREISRLKSALKNQSLIVRALALVKCLYVHLHELLLLRVIIIVVF